MRKSKGIVSKRHETILKLLHENKTIYINELVKILSVSPVTIRRDLDMFEKNGLIQKFYGGAKLIDGKLSDDPSLSDDSEKYAPRKHAIAKYAASFIEDGDTIFINSGSTSLLLLKYIKDIHVTVVTNNGKALTIEKDPKIQLILTGGEVISRKHSIVGDFALQLLSKITADKCFLSVSGINVESGISTSVFQETAINEIMLKRCNNSKFILTDSSKLGKEHNFLSGSVDYVDYVITDNNANRDEVNLLQEKGIKVITVDY